MTEPEAMELLAQYRRTRVRKIDGMWWAFIVSRGIVLGFETHIEASWRAHDLARL